MRKSLHFLTALLLLTCVRVSAQSIQFTSTPVTTAVENQAYNYFITAHNSQHDKLTFSAPDLPSWLTLSAGGGSSLSRKVNNSPVPNPGGVAVDTEGNLYAIPRDYYDHNSSEDYGIYKVTPDGTTTLWAKRPIEQYDYYGVCYSAIVVGDYLYVAYYSGYDPGVYKYSLKSSNPVGEKIYSGYDVLYLAERDGFLYLGHWGARSVGRIRLSDQTYSQFIPAGPTNFFGFTVAADGSVYMAAINDNKIVRYKNGQYTDVITNISSPTDVELDASGNLYVNSYGTKLRKYTPDLSSYKEVSDQMTYSLSLSISETGTIAYGNNGDYGVYVLETGVSLTGTPGHEHVGVHPVKIIASDGIVTEEQTFSITVTDPNAPLVTSHSPASGATDVSLTSQLSINFNEEVVKGTGSLILKDRSTNLVLETIDITSARIVVNAETVTVTPAKKLPSQTDVYVEIAAGAFVDLNGNNYGGINSPATWSFRTVEQAPQTITFSPENTATYGDQDFTPGASSDAGLDISYSSSDETIAIIVDNKIRVLKPGVTTITAYQEGNEDYLEAEPKSQTLTVHRKHITASVSEAHAIKKVYDGNRDVNLTTDHYELHGLLQGDVVSISGHAIFENADAGTGKTVFVDGFELSGEDKDNYSLETNHLTADGAILPKQVIVTLESAEKIYGSADPAFNYIAEGLINNDHLEGAPVRQSGKNAGTYTINEGTLSGGNNYELIVKSATFTIHPAPLVVKPENKKREQGKENPAFNYIVEGLKEGDDISVISGLKATTNATASSAIGHYEIKAAGAVSANYTISYQPGTLTVVPSQRRHVKVWSSSRGVVQVRVYSESAQNATISLFTKAGQTLVMQKQQLSKGFNDYTLTAGNIASQICVVHVAAARFIEAEKVNVK